MEIRPDFQRRYVWSDAARVMLMDTILRSIPMPKIFVSSGIKDGKTYRTVIDGQQRISTILAFLDDKFPLAMPYDGEFKGLRFSELPETVRNRFLQYRVDFNEAIEFTDDELRETYSRLNKYSVALTKQELRRADFPGEFLRKAEELALLEFFENEKLFTVANRRRLADVEFISELLAGLISGPQDKRESLDDFYLKYSTWEETESQNVENRFLAVLADIGRIFDADNPLSLSRFKQKADFYSLMLAIDDLRASGGALDGIDLEPLRMDFRTLQYIIRPESDSRDGRDYAIKCVSQANSHSSRRWRMEFLKSMMVGTYNKCPPQGDGAILMYRLAMGTDDPMCPPVTHDCPVCGQEIDSRVAPVVGWRKDKPPFQLDNIWHLHPECVEATEWFVISSEDTDRQLSFTGDPQMGLT